MYDLFPYYPPRSCPAVSRKPCQFHLSPRIPPQHTDNNCRHPRPPKHGNQPNFAARPWNHTLCRTTTPTLSQNQCFTTSIPQLPPPVDVTSENCTKTTGTFLLDGGTSINYITHPTRQMEPVSTPKLTHTANDQTTWCSRHGTVLI